MQQMKCKVYAGLIVAFALMTSDVGAETITDGDSTFDVRDGILYINTPEDARSTYGFVSLLSGVTNVIKTGSGTLVSPGWAWQYKGDWHVNEGVVHFGAEYSFGAEGTETDSNGTIYVADGASINAAGGTNAKALKHKDVYIAGSGVGSGDTAGAVSGINHTSGTDLQFARFHLAADAVWCTSKRCLGLDEGSSLDVAGHTLSHKIPDWVWYNMHGNVTNSASTPGRIKVTAASGARNAKFYIGGSWTGGSDNVLELANGQSYISKGFKSDWTLQIEDESISSDVPGTGREGRDYAWDGPVCLNGNVSFLNGSTGAEGYELALLGPMSGSTETVLTVSKGFCLKIGSKSNDFSGTWKLDGAGSVNYRTCIDLYKDAAFSGKEVQIDNADFHMDGTTVYQVPAVQHTAGDCLIDGGAEETEIQSIAKSGTGTLTLATPAQIPSLTLSAGTLALQTVPVISELICETGTTIVLNGITLEVDILQGTPKLVGEGKIVVRRSFTMKPGSVLDGKIDCAAIGGIVCVRPGAAMEAGAHVAFYSKDDVDLNSVYGQMAVGDGVSFSKRTVVEGEYAGYTLVEMSVTKTPATATWESVANGGAWSGAANWEEETPPGMGGATVTFPKASSANVPVTVDMNAAILGLTAGTGAVEADGLTSFGYSFTGDRNWYLGSENVTLAFTAGQNSINVPMIGGGTITLDTPLFPEENVQGAVFSKTVVSEAALEKFSGKVEVNPAKRSLNGLTELHTGKFKGSLSISSGGVEIDSLDFVGSRDDFVTAGGMTLSYVGNDVSIPGLTWNASQGIVDVKTGSTLSVADFYTKNTASALFKVGAGSLHLGGTGEMTFTGQITWDKNPEHGFDGLLPAVGRPPTCRFLPWNICQGTMEIGMVDDSANAPRINLGSLTMGNHCAPTDNARLVINNGEVNVESTLWLPYYTAHETENASREIILNGGLFHAAGTDARIGYLGSEDRLYGTMKVEVNGGHFDVTGDFNLTQLCPYETSDQSIRREYREKCKHTFTVNGGEAGIGNFKMGYSKGLSWDDKLIDNSGYGHGWQPDAYLTMNGGVLTVNDYLLTTDRADSRSFMALNGGVLKVNMISNTVGKAAETYLTFNGGTFAPTGDGDNADELVLKDTFTSVVVSTNGAVFSTEFLPEGKAYRIEQPLAHDARCDSADGGLTKVGAGELVLAAGGSTFTGPIIVNAGTLTFANRKAVPSKETDLYLASSAKVGIASGKVRVKSLTINGQALAVGTYGSSASAADTKDDAHFVGCGIVQVGPSGSFIQIR